MARKIAKVAERYRKALDNLQAAQQKVEEARAAWLEEAAAIRTKLIDELQQFAEAIAALEVVREVDRLVLSLDGRHLALVLVADGDRLDVEYPGSSDTSVLLGPEGDWLLSRGDMNEPLITRGLRRLLVEALGAPDPEGEIEAETLPEPEEEVVAEPEHEPDEGRGARDGEAAHMGRSGTRSYKRSRDLPPGAVVKDIKGPLG